MADAGFLKQMQALLQATMATEKKPTLDEVLVDGGDRYVAIKSVLNLGIWDGFKELGNKLREHGIVLDVGSYRSDLFAVMFAELVRLKWTYKQLVELVRKVDQNRASLLIKALEQSGLEVTGVLSHHEKMVSCQKSQTELVDQATKLEAIVPSQEEVGDLADPLLVTKERVAAIVSAALNSAYVAFSDAHRLLLQSEKLAEKQSTMIKQLKEDKEEADAEKQAKEEKKKARKERKEMETLQKAMNAKIASDQAAARTEEEKKALMARNMEMMMAAMASGDFSAFGTKPARRASKPASASASASASSSKKSPPPSKKPKTPPKEVTPPPSDSEDDEDVSDASDIELEDDEE